MAIRRPVGMSSRVHRAAGSRTPWTAPNGQVVDLPVVIDLVETPAGGGPPIWKVVATVALVEERPAITRLELVSSTGLEVERLRAQFRWATPLDIVTETIPGLLAAGLDPFNYFYPFEGFPAAAQIDKAVPTRLTDEFLAEIAARYLALGRGYAQIIADQRCVSPRTVVSWVEKARARGILSPTRPGAVGGSLRTPPT